jgi:2-amino-4-hydroxy-6-hydroxymethyldihydropteridine diphosphokinase
MSYKAYLLIGTNLGNKFKNLEYACNELHTNAGYLFKVSSIYRSDAWGYASDNYFLNAAVCLQTQLSPIKLLDVTKEIEKNCGRKEKTSASYQDRILDIDILLYEDVICNSAILSIPHPRFHLRRFTLKPLAEIAPDVIAPTFDKNISMLLKECSDQIEPQVFPLKLTSSINSRKSK